MTDREKLIDLINYYTEHAPHEEGQTWEEAFADHMISNGVTVQKWIPVKERIPRDGEKVLTCKNGTIEVKVYEKKRNGWINGNWFWSMATVYHWMPLPEPPKEEK